MIPTNKSIPIEMCIMGPRASGKTTYLASLLALGLNEQDGNAIRSGGLRIHKLEDIISNFIQQKKAVPPTDLNEEYDYRFDISIKNAKRFRQANKIQLSAKDLSGERFDRIFNAFINRGLSKSPKEKEELEGDVREFLTQCLKLNRWMFMLTEWQTGKDKEFFEVFKWLCDRIDEKSNTKSIQTLRVAVVMSKCERGEIWGGRLDPEADLFKIRLPKTYNLLKNRLKKKVNFFACSAYGILGKYDPRPNRFYTEDDGTHAEYRARLRDFDNWNPYGVIEPIYWLGTAEKLHNEFL
ncbi:hypothetical protein G7B40_000325 [Aetokthonos hydrillicola Thurmond2011]|jgi:hypothetical protein|uniref:Uncharacterized protein n=1 Tax=Aetokthonos hydrillicola Thurmond2011 TaxID=2712845 RepID=A0AAP5M2S3_9CYAN|nr:hypothetical protein [Aetokthonos hydrillicola]MBO3460174.1 hypothetical protein [Aetokthonos hydrillicola CCALA 1050]MBW4590560.1 hypothetical protein [Aetokthonos hydrillicola CCALA 1050]MDR9893031.1 hypothetical protein [Aetokthonos hydrillicola Thurmond2011]